MKDTELIGLDFETYGATDLPTHGLDRYVSCSTFTPLIASTVMWDSNLDEYISTRRCFHPSGFEEMVEDLRESIGMRTVVAHNAGFEQRVLASIGIDLPSNRFIDSAVVARAVGAGSSLEAAAPQLLGVDKLASGRDLIKLFSIPGEYQEKNGSMNFDPQVIEDNPLEWTLFGEYCDLDAELGLRIVDNWLGLLNWGELRNQAVTMDMNMRGWPVDIEVVEEMHRRYLDNLAKTEQQFRDAHGAVDLNLGSLKQLKEWCAERGIRATSFDEKNVAKMIKQIEARVGNLPLEHEKREGYVEVLDLLRTKQILGGSSLKKLQVILDTTSDDLRLRDQYLHIGAGQSWRTTGRGVQMQNLKRLSEPADMTKVFDLDEEWDNDKLAQNLRQCFTSSHPQGQLIVGDFSSVESRGLAWLAGAHWKLKAYRQGKDMYKVLASSPDMFNVPYDQVTKEQRQAGKVGELSCGYQAGGGAVQSFAEGMGVEMSEGEATQLVANWRKANPEIVQLWSELDEILRSVIEYGVTESTQVGPNKDFFVRIFRTRKPESLHSQHPGSESICLQLEGPTGRMILKRYFHGVYKRGNNYCYYKPSQRKTGDLWVDRFVDPKTKQVRFHTIYGGKLTGILTQSFCREIFFTCLQSTASWLETVPNVELIGQFHDEIVLDWIPGQAPLDRVMLVLKSCMSDAGEFTDFPLEADIKHDYRYTK